MNRSGFTENENHEEGTTSYSTGEVSLLKLRVRSRTQKSHSMNRSTHACSHNARGGVEDGEKMIKRMLGYEGSKGKTQWFKMEFREKKSKNKAMQTYLCLFKVSPCYFIVTIANSVRFSART